MLPFWKRGMIWSIICWDRLFALQFIFPIDAVCSDSYNYLIPGCSLHFPPSWWFPSMFICHQYSSIPMYCLTLMTTSISQSFIFIISRWCKISYNQQIPCPMMWCLHLLNTVDSSLDLPMSAPSLAQATIQALEAHAHLGTYLWILTLNFGDNETMARMKHLVYTVTFSVSVFKLLFVISTILVFYTFY